MSDKQLLIASLVAAALLVTPLVEAHAQSSEYAGAFLEIPVGSRALALGGAYTALADDQSAFHWNPAGVSLSPHKQIGFMYSAEYGTPGSALADFWHAGFTFPMQNVTLAVNWVRLSIGDLVHTPDLTTVNVTGDRQRMVREIFGGAPDYFSDHEDAFVLSVARDTHFQLDWGWLYYKQDIELPIGVNFKYIRQTVGTYGQSQGIGIDAGAMLRFSLGQFLLLPYLGKLSLGANITDLGTTVLKWNTERSHSIPMHLAGGIGYEQQLPALHCVATLSGDWYVLERQKPRFGLEVTYLDNVSLRAGMNRGLFATGAGFNWNHIVNLNYSLSINTDLGPEHRLSFDLDLDNMLGKHDDKQ